MTLVSVCVHFLKLLDTQTQKWTQSLTIEPSLEIIQFEASETRGEHKVAYSEIIYVGFKLPK